MKQEALSTLIRTGWGQDNPAFRQMFSTMFIPGASPQILDSYNEMMRIAAKPDVAARMFEISANIDVSDVVAQVQAPTLILHTRRDSVAPFDEGRRLAASIPNARIVELDSTNHIILPDEPAMPRTVAEIEKFSAVGTDYPKIRRHRSTAAGRQWPGGPRAERPRATVFGPRFAAPVEARRRTPRYERCSRCVGSGHSRCT